MLKSVRLFFFDALQYIFPLRDKAAIVQKLTTETLADLPKAPDVKDKPWVHPLFHYRDFRVKATIWELKYRENTRSLDLLGPLLYEHIVELMSDIILFDSDAVFLLIPIPISGRTRSVRGYNQSEYIAKAILEHDRGHFLLYSPQWLEKVKETGEQNKTNSREERIKNLKGAFIADPRVEDAYVILIDDVVTTGATLSESRETLLAAGAKNVYAFTISH